MSNVPDGHASVDDNGDVIEGGTVEALDDLPFHEEKHRAETARKMAFLLVWIMAISVCIHFVTTAIFSAYDNAAAAEGLAKIFNMWLPVISGLVSSAATYYFTKESQK